MVGTASCSKSVGNMGLHPPPFSDRCELETRTLTLTEYRPSTKLLEYTQYVYYWVLPVPLSFGMLVTSYPPNDGMLLAAARLSFGYVPLVLVLGFFCVALECCDIWDVCWWPWFLLVDPFLCALVLGHEGCHVLVIGGRLDIGQQTTPLFLEPKTLGQDVVHMGCHQGTRPAKTNSRLAIAFPIPSVRTQLSLKGGPGLGKRGVLQHEAGKDALMNKIGQFETHIQMVGNGLDHLPEVLSIGVGPTV